MARTPLFALVKRALRLASQFADSSLDEPAFDDLLEQRATARMSRRELLRSAAAVTASAAVVPLLPACATGPRDSDTPARVRIAVIGAGIGGLAATYHLERAGREVTVFEASTAVAGRMRSARDLILPGSIVELGGEFIDTSHEDLQDLARFAGVELIDLDAVDASPFAAIFEFEGRMRSEKELIRAFRPLATQLARDFRYLQSEFNYKSPGNAVRFDRLSLDQYLDRLGTRGWFRRLLETAFTTEMGLDANEQSALALLTMISTDTSEGKIKFYGESDERFVARGGTQGIADGVARRLQSRISFEHRLLALQQTATGDYLLDFRTPAGTKRVLAEVVCLAIPFTLLREVDIGVELPATKKRAIQELGYGTNAKAITGYQKAFWRELRYDGSGFSDSGYQSTWDALRGRGLLSGGAITFYTGGKVGAQLGISAPATETIVRFQNAFEGALLSSSQHLRTGQNAVFHWASHPLVKGSYSCYRPGQWTSFGGAEGEPVDRLFFAGEHCSGEFMGFMNGAAQSGREAAVAIDKLLRTRALTG
ncbi:MAG: FAD-dependent oxidoreductase [Bdellovibrionaceae bacterium]|nr:FAD-dependent oxidoreductase [Pseudobdellovibrionaceae bacterium]